MPVLALAMSSGGVLRAVGAARLAMSATLAGGLVNAVLDPILIFGLDLGVAGAAWASVAARATVFLVGAYGVIVRAEMLGRFKARLFGRDARAHRHDRRARHPDQRRDPGRQRLRHRQHGRLRRRRGRRLLDRRPDHPGGFRGSLRAVGRESAR